MTIAVAQGILDNPKTPIEAIGSNFVEWYLSKPKDIGITCESSIRRYLQCRDWKSNGQTLLLKK